MEAKLEYARKTFPYLLKVQLYIKVWSKPFTLQ
jgi:hypothetical protein